MKKSLTMLAFAVSGSVAFAKAASATRPASTKHSGTCILNDGAPTKNELSQFLCFTEGSILKVRCDLTGEGGNVQVGTLIKNSGKIEIRFEENENHGNSGHFMCASE